MARRVQAIFCCNTAPGDTEDNFDELEMSAVYDAPEWQEFTNATPWGEIRMSLAPDAPARDYFEPGAEYRVTFERVEEP